MNFSTHKITFLISVLLSFVALCSAQTKVEPTALIPNQPVKRQIVGGQTDVFSVALTAEQYAEATVAQKAYNLDYVLETPDGRRVDKTSYYLRDGRRTMLIYAAQSGKYLLHIRGGGHREIPRDYEISLGTPRVAAETDKASFALQVARADAAEAFLDRNKNFTGEQILEK